MVEITPKSLECIGFKKIVDSELGECYERNGTKIKFELIKGEFRARPTMDFESLYKEIKDKGC